MVDNDEEFFFEGGVLGPYEDQMPEIDEIGYEEEDEELQMMQPL